MPLNPTFRDKWLSKPYYSLDAYLKHTYGEKIYKIAIDAGLTCPNRDGTIDVRGCLFCSKGGSGDFATPLSSQSTFEASYALGKRKLAEHKHTGSKYIAYFQAYTNTYGSLSYLKEIYTKALLDPATLGISIATRPDCLAPDILKLLASLKEAFPDKFLWIELGLQTIHSSSAALIRRGYPLSVFEEAIKALQELQIPVIVHLILGLPFESREDMYASVSYLNTLPVFGVKLQLLHILKDTDLGELFLADPCHYGSFPTLEEYLTVLIHSLELLSPDIVIHRVSGDAPRSLLLAPLWSSNKKQVLNTLHKTMKEQASYQGKYYHHLETETKHVKAFDFI